MNLKIIATCYDCKTKHNIDDSCFRCNKCEQKQEAEICKELFKELDENIRSWDKNTVGFKSEEEKRTYIRSFRRGYEHAAFQIADFFGDAGVKLWEKFTNKWDKLPIKSKLHKDDADRIRKGDV